MMLPKNVSQYQFGSRLIPKNVLLQNNTELIKIFHEVIRLGYIFLATAVDASRSADITEHTSVDPSRRKAAFSAIFAT
jgi:hypothetical protein